MDWFNEKKYGLFIHFGLYSVLAGKYKGKEIPGHSEWIMNTAKIPKDEYEALCRQFDPKQFSADLICKKAKDWGMHYVCFTSKHHDGFALFDSKADDYNSVIRTPSKRDYVKEMAEACRKYNLKFCIYYSQAQDWHHPDGFSAYNDNKDKNFTRYLEEKCRPQVKELLTNYGEVHMLWFDTPMGMNYEQCYDLRRLVKSLQANCLINGRIGHRLGDYLTTQDNRIPSFPIEKKWEVPATLNHTWGYKASDNDWADAGTILHRLLRIVARGGNYLLNIGPKADGSIPKESEMILDEVGLWLKTCGDAIYNSRAIEPYIYETPELVFTHKDHKLFIHVLNAKQQAGRKIVLPNINNRINKAYWLNSNKPAKITEEKTLGGYPSWVFFVPDKFEEKYILTLAVETQEKDFKQVAL